MASHPDARPAVLVVDDDHLIRRIVQVTLRGASFRVLEASTAIEGLKLAREEHPRVVLLDIRLGSEDGLRVCKLLKSDPRTQSSRVLMLSGHDDPTTRLRARRAGADGFFAKPFSPLALWQAIDDVFES